MPTLDGLQMFVVIDGIERPIHVGDVLAQGQLVGTDQEQFCELPETTYGLAGNSFGQANVTLQITSDCQLVVAPSRALPHEAKQAAVASDSMKTYPTDQPGVRTFETRGPNGD